MRIRWTNIVISVLLIGLWFCAQLPLRAAAAPWVGYPVQGGIILVPRGTDVNLVRTVSNMIRDELPRIATAIGLPVAGPYPIYLYTNHYAFMHDSGGTPFLRGVSYRPTGVIRIDTSQEGFSLRILLAHELTHSALNQRLGDAIGELPTWVNEGIAGHLSDPVTASQLPNVARLVHRDGVLTLDELEHAFTTGTLRDAAYLQSRSMIAWLEYQYPGSVQRMLDALAHGQSFANAVHAAAMMSPQAWLQDWKRGVPALSYWISVLASPVVYAPFAVLVIILAIYRLRQKRARIRQGDPSNDVPLPPGRMMFGNPDMYDNE